MKSNVHKILFDDNLVITDYLKQSRLFKKLPDEFLKQFVDISNWVDYPANTEILTEGQKNDTVYILMSGSVSIYCLGEKIITLKRRGDIFGEMSIIGSRPCSASVISDSQVSFLAIQIDDINSRSTSSELFISNVLFRIFSVVLTDKLVLTTDKARHFEEVNRDLNTNKFQLQKALGLAKVEIAKRKQTEENLKIVQNQLKKSIEERTFALQSTSQELQSEVDSRHQAEIQSKENEARFRNLVEMSSDWIWEMDLFGKYTYVSPLVEKLIGYKTDEVMGKFPYDFVPQRNMEMIRAHYNKLLEQQESYKNMEIQYLHKNSGMIILESSGVPIYDEQGQFKGFRGIDRDITDRKWVEKNLIQARQNADDANQAKSEFLANMSHEIRTPMHGILSYSKFGTDRIHKVTTDKLLHYFKQINQSGKRLLFLLDDILDLSKMQAGKLEYDISNQKIFSIIENSIDDFRTVAKEKQIDIQIHQPHIPTNIDCDPKRIGQVVNNLLSNAIKFSPTGGRISININSDTLPIGKRSGDPDKRLPAISISVTDEGIGIPEEEIEYVFEQFTQSSKTKTGAGGTGLGLAICKKIVTDHGGTISVWNNKKTGVTFSFILPNRKIPIN